MHGLVSYWANLEEDGGAETPTRSRYSASLVSFFHAEWRSPRIQSALYDMEIAIADACQETPSQHDKHQHCISIDLIVFEA